MIITRSVALCRALSRSVAGLIFFLAFSHFVKAQDDVPTDYSALSQPNWQHLESHDDECKLPKLLTNVVTTNSKYATCFVEMADQGFDKEIQLTNKVTHKVEGRLVPTSGMALFERLPLNTVLEVFTTNYCGVSEKLGECNTTPSKWDVFEASPAFFGLIDRFGQQSSVGMVDFFKQDRSVSYYEKLAYIQQHFLDGNPLPDFLQEGEYPANQTARDGDCRCTFVISTVELISPGTQNADKSVTPENTHSHDPGNNDPDDPKVPFTDNSRWWWYKGLKGPAKYTQLWTEGWHAGAGDFHEQTIADVDPASTGFSSKIAFLQYNFNCTNYSTLPAECACEKPINFDWQYQNKITAFSNITGGSAFQRKAKAAVQDIVVVTLQESGKAPIILGSGTTKLTSECAGGGIPAAFWVNALQLAKSIAILSVAASGSGGTSFGTLTPQMITDLASDLTAVLTTPAITHNTCNSPADFSSVLALGNTFLGPLSNFFTLKPNKSMRISMTCFSNLMAGGQRNWFSYARIHSSYHLDAWIKGEPNPNVPLDFCCTKTIVNWDLGSFEDPDQTMAMKNLVGANFTFPLAGTNQPINPSGGIIIPTEFGYRTAKASGYTCDQIIINPDGGHRFVEGGGSLLKPEKTYSIRVLDVLGREFFSDPKFTPSSELPLHELLVSLNLPQSGIYLVNWDDGFEGDTERIYVK